MSNKEQNALQYLNLYINDSTPNQKIRDMIKELEEQDELYKWYKGLEFSRTGVINLQIKVLKELLEEKL